jgi:hypothetical protein
MFNSSFDSLQCTCPNITAHSLDACIQQFTFKYTVCHHSEKNKKEPDYETEEDDYYSEDDDHYSEDDDHYSEDDDYFSADEDDWNT